MSSDHPATLTLTPIGYVRTAQSLKFHARHQPAENEPATNVLELIEGQGYDRALRDLEGFERVWLIWWFHKNQDWRPLVLPPRGPAQRRGVFATRSPHRPNALGMSPVRLLGVEGHRLLLGPCDLVDGTPVFDVKPYLPNYDAFPEAKAGWIEAVDLDEGAPPRFTVVMTELAETQATWLRVTWSVDFSERLTGLLSRDPSTHRTRRIVRRGADRWEIGCGAWMATFTLTGDVVTVRALAPSYKPEFLQRDDWADVPDRAAQRAFLEKWPTKED